MQQVKLFKGIESEIDTLEKEINQWLKETAVRVTQLNANIAPQSVLPSTQGGLSTGGSHQRFAPSDLFVMIVYEAG